MDSLKCNGLSLISQNSDLNTYISPYLRQYPLSDIVINVNIIHFAYFVRPSHEWECVCISNWDRLLAWIYAKRERERARAGESDAKNEWMDWWNCLWKTGRIKTDEGNEDVDDDGEIAWRF